MMNYRKILLLTALFALSSSLLAPTAGAQTDTLTVRIKGMRCDDCFHKVRQALKPLPGIDAVSRNLERRTVTVIYDDALTCQDSIESRLAATHRFKASPYSPTDVIKRGFGLRIDDMFCQNCANRITRRLAAMEGIDSVAPHIDKHYVFIRYDANRTCKDSIRQTLLALNFTPVNYYTGDKVAFAYYNIPAEAATQDKADDVLLIDAVDDVTVNPRRHTMAVTYFCQEISADELLRQVQQAGIDAVVPPPHQCKEQ